MNLFIGNLSFQTTDEDLRLAFSAFGEIKSVTVLKDKYTNQSRGFGFVEMSNDEEAKKAIEGLNGKPINGRTINVGEARPREDKTNSSAPRTNNNYNRNRSW